MRVGARFSIVAATILVASPTWAVDPTDKCEAGKLKVAAKYASCRLKTESKAVLVGNTPDFGKCDSRFTPKFVQLEEKADVGVCPSEGDVDSIRDRITNDANEVAVLLSGGFVSNDCDCNGSPLQLPASGQTTSYGTGDDGDIEPGATLQYADNGDGTITDLNTGLMWERKILGTGLVVDCQDETGTCTNPHDADNTYDWTTPLPSFDGETYDGTLVTIFLEQLNNRCDLDPTVPCSGDVDCTVPGGVCGFAGYRDWRLPSVKELQSIVDYGKYAPPIDALFHGPSCGPACTDITNPLCACTTTHVYWSSTTLWGGPRSAWHVEFGEGAAGRFDKDNSFFARAVRGGS